jgi:hypothetical protein
MDILGLVAVLSFGLTCFEIGYSIDSLSTVYHSHTIFSGFSPLSIL